MERDDFPHLFGITDQQRTYLDALCRKYTSSPSFAWVLRHGAQGFHRVVVRQARTNPEAKYLADLIESYWQVADFHNMADTKVVRL